MVVSTTVPQNGEGNWDTRGVADRSFGCIIPSKGYAPDVPDYFKKDGQNYRSTERSLPLKSILSDSSLDSETQEPSDSFIRRLEIGLARFSQIISSYSPSANRKKPLIQCDYFLRLKERLQGLIEDSQFEDDFMESYRKRYDTLVKRAEEKSAGHSSEAGDNDFNNKPRKSGRPKGRGGKIMVVIR